ncbi:uncharacterized protein L969DRAFT_16400 [Mixia osmundae IAM 14324]|uniref:Uncharacterized protein n=1 Tax=Mixia osmundae (strain CBS 9802 / IAM 14324 / JCM 22182 / KY 12970) TaxID=764103 RepID=G7DUB8_MIXOS|nr:uncharacterized protein L969DRAFT_16400 [Mixia osmundae IAM 14324]KEI41050.1 hypothetical protein L969DRAFT_16400 [Mixia osmundae IAM 14324]GAA94178.1 hypothetical protein E5Q_00826 [Mixia osmundae IAM 14324]
MVRSRCICACLVLALACSGLAKPVKKVVIEPELPPDIVIAKRASSAADRAREWQKQLRLAQEQYKPAPEDLQLHNPGKAIEEKASPTSTSSSTQAHPAEQSDSSQLPGQSKQFEALVDPTELDRHETAPRPAQSPVVKAAGPLCHALVNILISMIVFCMASASLHLVNSMRKKGISLTDEQDPALDEKPRGHSDSVSSFKDPRGREAFYADDELA